MSMRKLKLPIFISTALTKMRLSMCSQIQERIVPVGKGRGSSLAKPERGAIFGSFTFLILNPTVYL
jgi:hypothetical protein